MITAALSQTIDQLPPEEYTMVEQYVNSIAEMVAKHQKARAWEKIKTDLIASEQSIKEEGTISVEQRNTNRRIGYRYSPDVEKRRDRGHA